MHHLPNIITVLRILLVVPVVQLLLDGRYAEALILFAVAGVSDGLDGFLARFFHWQSRLGSILDPLADKLLLVCSFLALGWQGLIPPLLVALVLLRDLVIVAGALAFHLRFGRFEMAPSRLSKANTLFQILLVLTVVLANSGLLGIPQMPLIVDTLRNIVWATTLISGGDYVWVWGRRALQQAKGDGSHE